MSRGSDYWVFRVPPKLRDALAELMRGRNERCEGRQWTRTGMIRTALLQLVRKHVRGGNKALADLVTAALAEAEEREHD